MESERPPRSLPDWKKQTSFITGCLGNFLSYKLKVYNFADEIVPGKIVVCSLPSEEDLRGLKEKFPEIKGVLSINEDWEFQTPVLGWIPAMEEDYQKWELEHLVLNSPDHEPLAREIFIRGLEFIDRLEGLVAVNCKSGKGRSVCLVMGWLLVHEYVRCVKEAYSYMEIRRPQISMNERQYHAVEEYHKYLLGCKTE